jgi:predicted deacylase
MKVLEIGNARAEPGTKSQGSVEVARQHDGSAVIIPVMLVSGTREGPALIVQAAIHGNEYPGVEAIWRLVETMDPAELRGQIIGVPVVNVPGFAIDERSNDIDHQDLNRVFPGRVDGTLSEKTAYCMSEEIISKGDYIIDLHTAGKGQIVSVAIAREGHEDTTLGLAQATGFEYIWMGSKVGESGQERSTDTGLRLGVPGVVLEAGSGREYRPEYGDILYEAVINIMKYLHMIEGQPDKPKRRIVFNGDLWAQVGAGGFFRPHVEAGQRIVRGGLIATVHDVYGHVLEKITAPSDGFICLINKKRSVRIGDFAYIFGDVIREEVLE